MHLPVNQQIVVGEPAVSLDGGTGFVEQGDIEVGVQSFPKRKVNRKDGYPSDGSVRQSVKHNRSGGMANV